MEGREMKDFYQVYADRYRAADDQTRKAARAHWTKCHAANMQTGRDDMIIFSARIMATIAVIDAETASE
jgi:hypothetical protein